MTSHQLAISQLPADKACDGNQNEDQGPAPAHPKTRAVSTQATNGYKNPLKVRWELNQLDPPGV
eukprot:3788745-Prymnesium_polylepis.1